MLHTKPQGHWPFGSGEEDFWRVFTIYGCGGHLGHVTQTPRTNFCSPIPLRLYMKFNFDRPNGFGEDLWKWWTSDGRRWIDDDGRMTDHGYTISSPISSSELIMSIINVGEIKNCDYSRNCLFFTYIIIIIIMHQTFIADQERFQQKSDDIKVLQGYSDSESHLNCYILASGPYFCIFFKCFWTIYIRQVSKRLIWNWQTNKGFNTPQLTW